MNELERILAGFEQSQQMGQRAALATVVRTSGSVYRRPGARMLLTEDGQMLGAISGGCLEGDVWERARSLLHQGGDPLLVRYDTTSHDDIVFGLGLGCNGVVDVLIESLDHSSANAQLTFIQNCLRSREVGVIATVFHVEGIPEIKVGDRLLLKSETIIANGIQPENLSQRIEVDARQSSITGKTRIESYSTPAGQVEVCIEVIHPPVPLLVFGAGYDAVPVVQFAKQLGWHVTVIDSRPAYLTGDRFPSADRLLCCDPQNLEPYQPLLTPQTAAVVMTHRYLSDLAFLKALIPSPLRYVGVLGPQRRMQQLWDDLAASDLIPTPEQQQRLYNPVGLDIAAETPEAIALAIVAEIQAVLGGRRGGSLRDRSGAIHASVEQFSYGASL